MSSGTGFDRRAHWERVYCEKPPGEVSWYQARPGLSLQLIRNTKVSTTDPVIDVGGGASTLVDCLCGRGHGRISVLDISARALDLARNRLGANASAVEWFIGDVTRFRPPHTFSVWHDRAVFHFLTDPDDRRDYVRVMKESLAPGGHVIMAAFAPGGPRRCSGLDVVQYDGEKLMRELGEGFSLMEQLSELHLTPGGDVQEFSWFRLRSTLEPAAHRRKI